MRWVSRGGRWLAACGILLFAAAIVGVWVLALARPRQAPFAASTAPAATTPYAPPRPLRAFHRDGQTFLIWKEEERLLPMPAPRVSDYLAARGATRSRYRVYRSRAPISTANLRQAELIDEVGPLTAFNMYLHGMYWDRVDTSRPLPTFVVTEGSGPLASDDGLYVVTATAPTTSHYAVVQTIDGDVRPSSLQVVGPIEEAPAMTVPVLQSRASGELMYGEGDIRHYVRWIAPPETNQPSLATNWVVALPASPRWPAPLQIGLHEWGATAWYGYGWWYGWKEGAILIATTDLPQTWWYGHHEAYGRRRPRAGDVVHNYTERRILSMLDWVKTRWRVDASRIFVAGSSMGGSGASAMAMRHGTVFAFGISWVGVYDFNRSPQFTEGFADFLGAPALGLRTEDGELVWNRVNLPRVLRQDPAAETAFLTLSNGKRDTAIGWPQAVDFVRALQETRRPFIFRWSDGGHGERAFVPTADGGNDNPSPILDIRRDRSLPAFTRGSLDDDPGNGDPADGAPQGHINVYLRWEPDTIVDRADRWEMSLYLVSGAPQESCTAHITPRRVQAFRPAPGTQIAWRNLTRGGELLQAGTVAVDRWGLITVPTVRILKRGSRLQLSSPPG